MSKKPQLVLLKKFNNLHEINIVKSFLQTKGFETIIFDEHISNLYATSTIFSGIRLMIKEEFKDQALKALHEQQQLLLEVPLVSSGDKCNQCGSVNTEILPGKNHIFWFLISLILFAPLAKQFEKSWVCRKCNHRWTEKDSSRLVIVATYFIRFFILLTIVYIFITRFITN